eukprot:scaffold197266_cov29-Tisochrysis_lutea.AAC.1
MMRPEMIEMKNAIKSLKRDAEIRLTLDVEAQHSFDFLSDQMNGLRRAFSTLSDVLVEEIDLVRAEISGARGDLDTSIANISSNYRAARAELTLLRTQVDGSRNEVLSRLDAIDERIEAMNQDAVALAQEVTKSNSAHHILQLEVVELRSRYEQEARTLRESHAKLEGQVAALTRSFEAHSAQTHETFDAVDADLGAFRQHASGQFASHAGGLVELRQELAEVAEMLDKHHHQGRTQQQQLEGISKATALQNQQLQVLLWSKCMRLNIGLIHLSPPLAREHQHNEARSSLSDTIKSIRVDVQLLQTHCRQLEAASSQVQAEARRQAVQVEAEARRQTDALGRAIQSLAETLNLTRWAAIAATSEAVDRLKARSLKSSSARGDTLRGCVLGGEGLSDYVGQAMLEWL